MSAPRFACDAMLCGLARWLRAYGYDATWTYGIADADLLAAARAEQRLVLSADRGIFHRRAVRRGDPPALYVPNAAPPLAQLQQVVTTERLARRAPRCMRCGGELAAADKDSVAGEVPPRTLAWIDRYDRCQRCRALYWRGTHFPRICARLDEIAVPGASA